MNNHNIPDPKDYANSGLDIQSAMVDQLRRFPRKEGRPSHLLWNGLRIKTSDKIEVPDHGIFTARFISGTNDVEQGYDLKLDDGWLRLVNGEEVRLLRTWRDRRFEDTVKYSFFSRDNTLWFWNVYKRQWPKGSITEEKWTGNAGFWIEEAVGGKRIYHCSHGMSPTPNFESLVVEIRIEKFGVL